MGQNTKTVGVLGGMGADATVDFMARVVALTPADGGSVRMLVDMNPGVPDRQAAILRGGTSPAPVLAAMARALESIGADCIVMPCNTAHAFADAISTEIDVPFISMIDACVEALDPEVQTAGLLATRGCVEAGIFQTRLAATGITAILPTKPELDTLNKLVVRIQAGDRGASMGDKIVEIADQLVAEGAEALIAGCTEIPLVLNQDRLTVPLLASTEALAVRTVGFALGQASSPRVH